MHTLLLILILSGATAYFWVADTPEVGSSLFTAGQRESHQQPGATTCPFNSNHQPAAPYNSQYPYNGALNGLSGSGQGSYQVPAPGDEAHKFVLPSPSDIREPRPGLNAAANHDVSVDDIGVEGEWRRRTDLPYEEFLAHDGITAFKELVDMQQNVKSVAWELAVVLAAFGIISAGGMLHHLTPKMHLTDISIGDIVTEKLSIGCDATSRTP
ncbi:hypothetical protein K469DRAFT_343263 [Zopfia rhizophila CBS 207.26]|uniref:Uncharacterized protein n=1 Tax=Zopfia rhizophila CBS 207.26 TaxID=1314779 RepID=A0A6A6EID8_9PEZI|nr:hypothetical protein K469DRAFT_343263 [Zopfia rhizophila CBS 207.26]